MSGGIENIGAEEWHTFYTLRQYSDIYAWWSCTGSLQSVIAIILS